MGSGGIMATRDVVTNIKGITGSSFKLGKSGATINTGTGTPVISGTNGDFYFDTTNGRAYIYDATGWVRLDTLGSKNNDELSNQAGTVIVRRSMVEATTIDDTLTYLTRADYPNIVGQTEHIQLPNNCSCAFEVDVVGRSTTPALNSCHYNFKGLINVAGNTGSFADVTRENIITGSHQEWLAEMAVGVSGSNALIQVGVTGVAGATIKWMANIEQTINVLA